jgi:hypothetical protein
MDEIDIIVSGYSDGGASLSCAGFAKQAPGFTGPLAARLGMPGIRPDMIRIVYRRANSSLN